MPFKGSAEDAFAGKACVETDFLDGKPCIFQQIFCGADAGVEQVFVGRKTGFFFEDTDEMILAQTGHHGQRFHRDAFRVVFVYIGNRFFNRPGMMRNFFFRGAVQEECGQDIVQVF